jgi:hypothetical protein
LKLIQQVGSGILRSSMARRRTMSRAVCAGNARGKYIVDADDVSG